MDGLDVIEAGEVKEVKPDITVESTPIRCKDDSRGGQFHGLDDTEVRVQVGVATLR